MQQVMPTVCGSPTFLRLVVHPPRPCALQGCGIAAFTPISDVVFERFAAIVRTAPFNGTILKFNASSGGTVVPGSVSSDFVVSSGASVQPEGLGGDLVIRSGDPQTSAVATYSAHVLPGG